MQVRFISNITKEYPNNMYKILIYKTPRPYIVSECNRQKKEKSEEYTPRISSLHRTKTLIKDIVLCNDFDLFCTFTFDPDKVDRFNYNACLSKMNTWLHNQKVHNPDLKYLIIPEQHKNGAWHFHGLIAGYCGSIKNSHHKSNTGREVFNLTSYRSGFTTAVKIDSKDAVANYVTKYITKAFIKKFNRRRFFCSKNLTRPVKTINSPIFRNSNPANRQFLYDGGDFDYFQVVENF